MAETDRETLPITSMPALGPNTSITIQRKLYTQDLLDKEYEDRTVSPSVEDHIKNACTCSIPRVFKVLLAYFPVIGIIRNYTWKMDVVNDFISGLAVSFMQMPQSLALGLLASVPPVFGLYSTFYPVLLYVVFGTCPHISMGTNALLSLVTAGIAERELEAYMGKNTGTYTSLVTGSGSSNGTTIPDSSTDVMSTMSEEEQSAYKVGVATAVALASGVILLGMGILRLGFMTSYLSTSFVGGFTTAAALHIASGQIPKMLKIKIPAHRGAGRIVRTYIDIFKNIAHSNVVDVIISAVSILFLLIVTILVNERYRSKLRVPIPLDLIIVVVSTLISYLANLEDKFGVAVVGDIPQGLPVPIMPDMDVMSQIVVDSFMMAILNFTLSIALAKMMASKHNYAVDPNQELVAYGISNFLGSFFRCIPVCTAPARTMILSNSGAKSTLNGLVTAVFILLTLLAAGQLFVSLPVAVLGAMICVAIKNLLLQVNQLPDLWRISKPDFCIWLITFIASVFIDLDIGIAVGIGISICVVIVRNQLVSGTVGGLSKTEDLVLFGKGREGIKESQTFRIFHFPAQLFFANAERFSKEIFSKAFDPLHVNAKIADENVDSDSHNENDVSRPEDPKENSYEEVKFVILECSAITYIDLAGANVLKKVSSRYQKVGVTLLLAKCPAYTLDLLDRAGYFKTMERNTVFCDIFDAVTWIHQMYM